ncbi:MAG: DoxX family protein [Myxococcota bacterium]
MKLKIAYFATTGLLSAMMLMSAGMYLFNTDEVANAFTGLGYPTYLIYPLAIAKILGLVAIWSRADERLRGLAYAGYFFNFLLALVAHVAIGDEFAGPVIALVLLMGSYFSGVALDARVERPSVAVGEPVAA